jgi:riboflavin kinase/FMN adenylyltransferase
MKRSIALGYFDGLHVAHMAVLQAAAAFDGLRPAVLLFDEHPQGALRGGAPPARLLVGRERDEMLRGLGIEVLKVPFRDVMELAPEAFFDEVLRGQCGAEALCCGYHYRFGHGARGDAALLHVLCGKHGMPLTVVSKMEYQGAPVSSTRIREALEAGALADANAMLGRAFGYAFPVMEGDHIGRTLGFPTANQMFEPGFVIPAFGAYASEAKVGGVWRRGVTNIGQRPSFESEQLRSETHSIGFAGDLYGQALPVRLLRFLRCERRFNSMEALKQQIAQDVGDAGM